MSATASSSSLVGFTLEDRYRILREIGRGGMGVVYEAEHTQLGKHVAVKLMLEKYADDTEAVARFKREALAASTIGNSHIIDVSHIGRAPDGRPFVVMELLIGAPLAQVIEQTGPMAHWRAISIMRQVLRAVGAAHAKGIVHRDLKPDNIFLVDQDDQPDFVKLLDFGISKMMDGEGAVAHTKLTTTGMVMGTPLYMAPEQAMGTAVDHHADIYALGVILYEMLSGRPPFEGATYPVLIAKLLTTDPTPILERVPGLPARLVAAVHRALEKDPDKRWASCEAFYAALPVPSTPSQMELAGTMGMGATSLQMHHIGLPTARGAAPTVTRRRNALWIAIAAAAGVAVAGVAVFALTKHPGEPAPAPQLIAAGSALPGPTAVPIEPRREATALPQPAGSATAPAGSAAERPGAVATGKLHVQCVPTDATIAVDGVPSGLTGSKIVLGPGPHRIHVEHAGFAPHDEDVQIAADETTAINVKLVAAPAGRPPLHGPGSSHSPIVVGPGSATLPASLPTGHGSGGDAGSAIAAPHVPHDTTVPHEPLPPHDPPPHDPHGVTPKPNPY